MQVIYGARLGALILHTRVAAANALQAVCGVESEQIGEGMPLKDSRIDLPLIAAQQKTGAFAVGVGQNGVELPVSIFCQLQLAGGLFIRQTLIGTQIGADEDRADGGQEKNKRSGPMCHSAQHSPPAQATDRSNEK